MIFDVSHPEILDAVYRALAEDIGTGDVTTDRKSTRLNSSH